MYKVIVDFADLQDKQHIYHEGDTYPREGVNVEDGRIKELLSGLNKLGKPLIKEVVEKPIEKPIEKAPEPLKTEEPEVKPKQRAVKPKKAKN